MLQKLKCTMDTPPFLACSLGSAVAYLLRSIVVINDILLLIFTFGHHFELVVEFSFGEVLVYGFLCPHGYPDECAVVSGGEEFLRVAHFYHQDGEVHRSGGFKAVTGVIQRFRYILALATAHSVVVVFVLLFNQPEREELRCYLFEVLVECLLKRVKSVSLRIGRSLLFKEFSLQGSDVVDEVPEP